MYYRIKKISNEEFNERRAQTAIEFAVCAEKGELPWQKSFDPEKDNIGQLPYDVINKKYITGYNMVELTVKKPEEKQFITFGDVQKENYRVKKGARSTPIEDIRKYDISYPVDPKTKKWTFTMTPSEKYIAYNKAVFSVNDLSNKYNFEQPKADIDGIDFTRKLLSKTGVKVVEEKGLASAYYAPRRDEIHIGEKEQYKTEREYYADLLRQTVRSLTKPGRAFQNGSKGFGKNKNDIEFIKDKFRVDLAVYQLSCMLKFPYKPSMNSLNNKQLLYNYGNYPNYLASNARDSEIIMRKAVNLYLDRQKTKEADKTKEKVSQQTKANTAENKDKTQQTVKPQTVQAKNADINATEEWIKIFAENKDKTPQETKAQTAPKATDIENARIVSKEEFVDRLKARAAMRSKQAENKQQTIKRPDKTLEDYIVSSIKAGKLSDRAIIENALKQPFKEFDGKTVIEKRKLVYSLKNKAYSQDKALAR